MIEWLLTDNHLFFLYLSIALVTVISVLAALILSTGLDGYELKSKTRGKLSIALLALAAVTFLSGHFLIERQIVTENLTEGDWVQIYSNDQNANISIYFSPTSYIKAGEELSSSHLNILKKLYSRNKVEDVAVAASKDGAEERRVVKLDGRNISIPLDKDYSMKITKIEYQKIVGQRKTLFGHHGNVTSSTVDGQIKITVNGEKSDQSLKELFDGKNQ